MHPIRTRPRPATRRNIGNRYSADKGPRKSRFARWVGKSVVDSSATPNDIRTGVHCHSIPGLASTSKQIPALRLHRNTAPTDFYCSRTLLHTIRSKGRTTRIKPLFFIPVQLFSIRRLRSDNATSAAIISARKTTRTNSHRHKNIRLSKSMKALPGLKTGS